VSLPTALQSELQKEFEKKKKNEKKRNWMSIEKDFLLETKIDQIQRHTNSVPLITENVFREWRTHFENVPKVLSLWKAILQFLPNFPKQFFHCRSINTHARTH
jgi:hypothetical protein